jgi:hypothetical protein
MSEYEVRVQRAAYFYGALQRGWRKLSAALARVADRALSRARAVS